LRILYFNYMTTSFASIVRSLEYAKGAADQGHEVALCYLHPAFRPPESYYDLIAAYESPRLRVHYPARRPAAASPQAGKRLPAGKVVEGKPTLKGLYRQIAASFRYVPEELRWVDRFRPDVLMARPDQVFSFLVTSRLRSLPLVLETDGPVEELDRYWGLDSRWVRPLDTWRARNAHALLYISGACRELWRRKRIPEERLFYTPNAAHPDRFRPLGPEARAALRRGFGLAPGAKVIGFSGNLRAWHGAENLLEAALPLLAKDPDLRILFIGAVDDPAVLDRCRVPEAIRRERLVFTGPVPYARMGEHIDLADVLALPYPYTDFFYFSPMKLFEGMSLGKILVAPRLGQIEEMLGDLESPVLYDAKGGARALGEALETGMRRALSARAGAPAGEDARRRIEEAHTWAHRGRMVARACEYAVRRAGRKAAA
jgi:glycosyltransferase involved in cell wall biosynthesis